MGLLEICMDGLIMNPPDGPPVPVDFILEAPSLVVMTADWWTTSWHFGWGVFPYARELEQIGDREWQISDAEVRPITIAPPDGSDEQHMLNVARRKMDIDRSQYVIQLRNLSDALGPDFDLGPWRALVRTRPAVDPVVEFRKRTTRNRKIGRIYLLTQDNEKADVLVIDEDGHAATARGTPWLESFADRWIDIDPRPELEEYLQWVSEQRPYGPFQTEAPAVLQKEGSIEDIARAMS